MNRSIVIAVLLAVLVSGCGVQHSGLVKGQPTTHEGSISLAPREADTYKAIYWNDTYYAVGTNLLPAAKVGKRIGTVGAYPQSELSVSTNVNARLLPIGTLLFKILGTPTSEAVAVEVAPNRYIAAIAPPSRLGTARPTSADNG